MFGGINGFESTGQNSDRSGFKCSLMRSSIDASGESRHNAIPRLPQIMREPARHLATQSRGVTRAHKRRHRGVLLNLNLRAPRSKAVHLKFGPVVSDSRVGL